MGRKRRQAGVVVEGGAKKRNYRAPSHVALSMLQVLDTAEEREMAMLWYPAAVKLSREREKRDGAERGEYLAFAWEAVTHAVKGYKPETGNMFSTYVWSCIVWRLHRQTRQVQEGEIRRRGGASLVSDSVLRFIGKLDEPLEREGGPTLAERRLLVACLADLTEEERSVLWLRHVKGMTLRKIAISMGVTHEWVRQIQERALRRARLSSRVAREDEALLRERGESMAMEEIGKVAA